MSTSASPAPPLGRCAVHPVRRAVDRCPVCDRPRCAADAALAPGGGCPVCDGAPSGGPAIVPATPGERFIRAGLAAHITAVLGGVVAAQYVGAELFAYLTPFVVGVLVAAAAQSASGSPRTASSTRTLRLLASGYALLGVALGFVIEQSEGVLATRALLPYVAAVAGVLLWTLPPKRARAA